MFGFVVDKLVSSLPKPIQFSVVTRGEEGGLYAALKALIQFCFSQVSINDGA